MKTKRNISSYYTIALAFAAAPGASAATLATVGVPVEETFATVPLASNWSTVNGTGIGGNGNSGVTSPATMVTVVNNGDANSPFAPAFTSSLATTILGTVTSYTTGQAARYNSTTQAIFTQPTNNYYTALMATVANNTGGTLSGLEISYDLVVTRNGANQDSEVHAPGFRVFYSTDGAAGSWTSISNLSGQDTTGTYSAELSGLNWASGANLYVLFADDNDAFTTDATLAITKATWTAIPEPSSALLCGLGALALLRRRR